MEVPTRSAKSAIRASVSGGSGPVREPTAAEPQIYADDDGNTDHGLDAKRADDGGRVPGRVLVAVHPGGPAGAQDRRGDVLAIQR